MATMGTTTLDLLSFSFNLNDGHLVIGGGGHEDSILNQESVTRLHGRVILIIILVRRILWGPLELLVRASECTGPEELLLHTVTCHVSHLYRNHKLSLVEVNQAI